MLASKAFKVVLAVLLSLAIVTTIVWVSYLGPRVRVKTFSLGINPILDDLIWADHELDKLFKENPGKELDLTKAEDRDKFNQDIDNLSAKLAQAQIRQKRASKRLKSLSASQETEKFKESIVKLSTWGIESVPRLQALFDYAKKLAPVFDMSAIEEISDREPASFSEAQQQISELGGVLEKISADINNLKPPTGFVGLHTELQDVFAQISAAVGKMKEGLDQSDEAKFLAAVDEFEAIDSDFASFDFEKSSDQEFNNWIAEEDKLLKQVERESKKLLNEFGPFWAFTFTVEPDP
ncbi:MAG TPA: hypothetical protein ENI11_06430 [Actinobacteria bacterium]|nr:hypothetical protein [Actinomycetota bacterium]